MSWILGWLIWNSTGLTIMSWLLGWFICQHFVVSDELVKRWLSTLCCFRWISQEMIANTHCVVSDELVKRWLSSVSINTGLTNHPLTKSIETLISKLYLCGGGSFSPTIFKSDIKLSVYHISCFSLRRFIEGKNIPKMCTLFCLVHIKMRSFLTACEFWFWFPWVL